MRTLSPRLAIATLALALIAAPVGGLPDAATAAPSVPFASADTGPSWSVAPADRALPDGTTETGRANFDYAVEPGAVIDDAFEIRNDGAAPLELQVYAADAFTTREGSIDLLPAGTPSTDAGAWISVAVPQVTLQPGETTAVPFRITVPADARPGDHPAGLISSTPTASDSATVQVDRRLGSRVYLRVEGDLTPSAAVSGMRVDYSGSWNPLAVGALDIVYTLENTGDTRVTAVSSVTAGGPFGLAGTSASEQLAEVLPGSAIEVRQRLDGVAALVWLSGAVQVLPEGVGLGGAALEPVDATFSFAAVPFVPLIVLIASAPVVLAIVLLVRTRHRRPAPVSD
ncbi:DUF916 domain-containing protein [Herbiconiux sp. CPCC 205716]|uniref:DUF916 domain-containing protein n=1 Tax=Herbiconiux gentiana TaxID=2970912 RepID=A0ABT2GIP7_9MICO|nr:DUF916 domain-containing protein [Herbiconiux gentiana]MCS5716103.1 DUF916 domain-containing protein [Herbiconiux gentiana]